MTAIDYVVNGEAGSATVLNRPLRQALTALGLNPDDVIAAWLTQAAGDARYPLIAHNHDSRYYTESEADGLLSAKSPVGHDHNSNYYLKSEVVTLLSAKAAVSHAHAAADITSGVLDAARVGSGIASGSKYLRDSGVWELVTFAQLANKPTTLVGFGITDAFTQAEVNALLTGKSDNGHAHAASDITSGIVAPPRLASGTRDGTKFLRDDGTWQALTAGGGLVESWNGRSGVVVPAADDYTFAQVGAKPTTLGGYGITDAYTEAETDALLATKSDTSHNHDTRYYTEAEADALLADKSAVGHTHDDRYYTESEVDALLTGKAATSHTHPASDIASGTIATARLGSGTADATTFLRGDQTWAVVAAGLSGGGTTGKLAKWSGTTALEDSLIREAAGAVIVGTDPGGSSFFRVGGLARFGTTGAMSVKILSTDFTSATLEFEGGAAYRFVATSNNHFQMIGPSATIIDVGANDYIQILTRVGFNGSSPIAKPSITGSRRANPALASMLTELANYGLVTDSSTVGTAPDGSGTGGKLAKWSDTDTLTDSLLNETGGNIEQASGAFQAATLKAFAAAAPVVHIERTDATARAWRLVLSSAGSLVVRDETGTSDRWAFTTSGHLLAGTTNSYDIGASAGNKPRNIYAAGNMLAAGIVDAGTTFQVAGFQVMGARIGGWGTPTGTATRTTFATDTVTLIELARRVKALVDDLKTHGMLGA